jgi:hypothetical protein
MQPTLVTAHPIRLGFCSVAVGKGAKVLTVLYDYAEMEAYAYIETRGAIEIVGTIQFDTQPTDEPFDGEGWRWVCSTKFAELNTALHVYCRGEKL